MKYDCTYWWKGGTERGEWVQADAGKRAELNRMGYVAADGKTSIGAPDGPPSLADIQSVLRPLGFPV